VVRACRGSSKISRPSSAGALQAATYAIEAVGDALNGVAWVDDAQIAVAIVDKYFADVPGLTVWIGRLG
jgi:hypothetical protein